MLQSQKNKATIGILSRLRQKGMPEAQQLNPAPTLLPEEEAMAGEEEVVDDSDSLEDPAVPLSPEEEKKKRRLAIGLQDIQKPSSKFLLGV